MYGQHDYNIIQMSDANNTTDTNTTPSPQCKRRRRPRKGRYLKTKHSSQIEG